MADIIRLLPDSVANQIAAGEVVQRPSSALKELLENAIDAGASDIRVVLRESGKSLIQVIDNGSGMSERDARLCFERHATSKIASADDLLSVRTLGFRGEALASIASIAQVEMKTRKHDEEIGTCVVVEGSEVISQSPSATSPGTNISVKNLFFNVPARRNFLKSNSLELKYLLEEFSRVALVNPSISFSIYHHDKIIHQLAPENLKNRIINLFGSSFNQKLIPVEQNSSLVNITGFIGKPEFAKKSRGEQFFFTNGRFIRNPYLHHAVEQAFKELIPGDAYPTYFLYFEVDPRIIDVNIHPTKTEINFQDSKSMYAILHAAVKLATGKFNLTPTLYFDTEQSLTIPPPMPGQQIRPPVIQVDPAYNPFEKQRKNQTTLNLTSRSAGNTATWQKLYAPSNDIPEKQPSFQASEQKSMQVSQRWIITYTRRGIVVIDQQHAHERILYEQFLDRKSSGETASQQLLLPHTFNLRPAEATLLEEIIPHLSSIGFIVEPFGNGSFLVTATPAGTDSSDMSELIEYLIDQHESLPKRHPEDGFLHLARSLALKMAVKRGVKLSQEEIDRIVEQLFACKSPEISPTGKPALQLFSFDDLQNYFKT